MVQRVVGADLPPGTIVVDDQGHFGRIVSLDFNPRDPAYEVDFESGRRRVPLDRLRVPAAVPASGRRFDSDDEGDGDDSIGGHDNADTRPLLAGQHEQAEAVRREARGLRALRPGKSAKDRDFTGTKDLPTRVLDYGSRVAGELVVDPRDAVRGERHYSVKGSAGGVHRAVTRLGDATIGNPMLTPVESVATGLVGAAVGTHRRAGRTPGQAAKLEEKAGHILSALGALLQTVPLIGAAAAPLSGGGTFMQEHAKGASKKQAAARAAAATAGGAIAGLIPGYGTYSGTVGLINECRKIFSSVEQHGDPAYAHSLQDRMQALETLAGEIESAYIDDEERRRLLEMVGRELVKARSRYETEMRRRTKTGRGSEGAKTALLEETWFGAFEGDEESHEESPDDLI